MISDIIKFALEVVVVSFIAYYVSEKMKNNTTIADAGIIGLVAACIITVIEKSFIKKEESFKNDDDDDDNEEEEEDDDDENFEDVDELEQFVTEDKKVVVKVGASGIVKQANPATKTSTKQLRGRLSMQEQKIVDAVQKKALTDERAAFKKGGVRVNKNYGYSFLPPSEWNLPLPDIKKCIPQKVCEPCPVFVLDSGAYLQVQGAKQLPPKAPTKSTV